MRRAKIVCTIGPATNSYESLKRLINEGMDIARLNFSHGSHETHGATIKLLNKLQKEGHDIAILLDTKGPEIRTGDVKEAIKIRLGQQVLFSIKEPTGKEKITTIKVNYPGFVKDARRAKIILIDNGVMEFKVMKFTSAGVIAKALDSGSIGSRRHVNMPGADISLPSFTKKDWEDIDFGIKMGVDFFAPSFVRTGSDIAKLRAHLHKKKSNIHIVAKIETTQAVEDIDSIVELSDAIMVARGDLGSEMPFEFVPGIQDMIVRKCREEGKPVIVATHMLESMIENPMPTRAEVTDIAHAALTQSDAVMLSGETAGGKHPFKALEAMHKVVVTTEERSVGLMEDLWRFECDDEGTSRVEQARSACVLAEKMNATAMIVITKAGHTARAVSRFRPFTPILAFTPTVLTARQLHIAWGVQSFILPLSKDPEKTVKDALTSALKMKKIRKGDTVIVVSDVVLNKKGTTNHVMSVQIRTAS